jgi:hypothetical protein
VGEAVGGAQLLDSAGRWDRYSQQMGLELGEVRTDGMPSAASKINEPLKLLSSLEAQSCVAAGFRKEPPTGDWPCAWHPWMVVSLSLGQLTYSSAVALTRVETQTPPHVLVGMAVMAVHPLDPQASYPMGYRKLSVTTTCAQNHIAIVILRNQPDTRLCPHVNTSTKTPFYVTSDR